MRRYVCTMIPDGGGVLDLTDLATVRATTVEHFCAHRTPAAVDEAIRRMKKRGYTIGRVYEMDPATGALNLVRSLKCTVTWSAT